MAIGDDDADEDDSTVANVVIEARLGGVSGGGEESRCKKRVVGVVRKKWKEYTQCKQVCSVIPCMSNVELIRSAGP